MKERKKKIVVKNWNHKYKTFAKRTQNDDDYNMHNINNKSVKLVSNNEIIKEKK